MMHIGILQCGQSPDVIRPQFGDYPAMFQTLLAKRGLRFTTWHVEAMAFPDSPDAAEGWLITGSRHGVYEDHAFIPPLESFIRQVYDLGLPMVGVCFGHQIIAQALGGRVVKYPGGWAIGSQDYDFDTGPMRLNAWHQDQVVARPDGAEVIGHNDFCENAALIYRGQDGTERALTVQAHPEFENGFIGGLIEHRAKGVVPAPLIDTARARLNEDKDNARFAERIADFFIKNRKKGAAQG